MGRLMIRLVKEGKGSPLFLIGAGFVQVCLSALPLHGIFQTDCLATGKYVQSSCRYLAKDLSCR